ncbi:MAG: PKD domain-containing protein [Bacteroidetes bacterium]|nr:PKD domain-containing protein [Bacteroidota bacterium]
MKNINKTFFYFFLKSLFLLLILFSFCIDGFPQKNVGANKIISDSAAIPFYITKNKVLPVEKNHNPQQKPIAPSAKKIPPITFAGEICNNGIDDDGDGLIDLNDTAECVCNGFGGGSSSVPSLIPNQSFEQMNCCPSSYSQVSCATGWIQASTATSDYMNTCGIVFGAATSAGLVPFPDGNGILGAIFSPGWQEYVGSCLSSPMLAGQSYTLQMNIASTPIDNFGGVCNGGVIDFSAIDIVIYGSTNCGNLPFSGVGCPPSPWQVLGFTNYTPVSSWGIISITFTPPVNINAIIFGSPCTLPPSYSPPSGCYPYFYYDNILLNTTASFSPLTINQTGIYCQNNIVITSHTDTSGGTWQWYENGIAIAGQNDSILDISGNNLPPGAYTAVYTVGSNCDMITDTVPVPPPPIVANFSATSVCLGNPTLFTDLSTGGATSWSWSFGDGNTSTLQNPSNTYAAAGNYTVTLTVLGAGGCDSAIPYPITVYPQPLAAFVATTVCLGNATQFTDQSTGGGTAWNWNFGDGNTSTLQSPSHTYSASGTYTATLNVSATPGGCNSVITQVVTVNAQPTANFSATSVCINNPTQFTDLSTGGGTSWSWNFGDGNTSTLQNPSNTYAASGNYTVTLTVTAPGGCTSTFSLPATVYPQAIANFSATTVCVNTPSTQFADLSTGAATWNWNFGDPASGGNNISSQQNPSHSYTASGTYSVTLIATTNNGCSDTLTQIITVNPKPAATFIVTTACFNNATVFTDLSTGNPTQWDWDFGDGNDTTLQNPSHTYNTAGTYTATLIATNTNGCKDTIALVVTVNPLPFANFSATSVCVGNTTCFVDSTTISSGAVTGWGWNFGDPNSGANNISNLQNPCHLFTASGNFVVILTATSNNGCQSTTNLPVVVYSLPVAAFTANNVCQNIQTSFTDGSFNVTQWAWNFGDGNTSALQSPGHIYQQSGTYTVTLIVTSAGSCTDTVTGTVTVYPLPVPSFIADSVCEGLPTSFTDLSLVSGGTISTWNWNFGDGTPIDNGMNPSHIYSSDGNYNVTLTVSSNNGCISSLTIPVIVFQLPAADFSYSPGSPIGLSDDVSFTDISIGGAVQWWWDFGDTATSLSQNPIHVFTDIGTYVITLIVATNHGCMDTVQRPLEIQDYTFYIPNAFTPNGDGNNDFFFGVGIGIVEYEMFIFDRWGNRIFYCKVNDPGSNGAGLPQTLPCMWDGKVDGGISSERVQEDVYVWKVRLKNVFNLEYNFIGTVTVVR